MARVLVETIAARRADAALLLSCEHASQIMPHARDWHDEDRWLVGTHWAYDIGAADLTRELAADAGAAAVLAGFTRLYVDPNRPLDSPTLIREHAEGRAIAMNRALAAAERDARIAAWRAYHEALGRAFAESRAPLALAIHSFTPVYEGQRRSVEIGVLFDREDALAAELRARLAAAGFDTRLNEPYSGKEGLIFSIDAHASRHARPALELEVRQDLCADPAVRRRIAAALRAFATRVAGEGIETG